MPISFNEDGSLSCTYWLISYGFSDTPGPWARSPCKIHGIDRMIVTISCKTCEQSACKKCVDMCKRLNHVIKGQPGRFLGGPTGHMLHLLSRKKQKCLSHLQDNEKRQTSWGTQVDQIRHMVKSYTDKWKEKIHRDIEIKIKEIDKVEIEVENSNQGFPAPWQTCNPFSHPMLQ